MEVTTKPLERAPLNLADPKPLQLSSPEWIVVTPENAEEVWKRLREKNVDVVLFGLTDDGYEQLAIDMAQIRNFIAQQRELLLKYREYYEPPKKDNKK